MIIICSGGSHSDGRQPPKLPGFTEVDEDWQLQFSYYQEFVEDITGVKIADEPSQQQLKTVQSRIEGCVASYKRSGECLCQDLSSYEHIDSMATVHELSRFFRVLVSERVESQQPA